MNGDCIVMNGDFIVINGDLIGFYGMDLTLWFHDKQKTMEKDWKNHRKMVVVHGI